MKKTLLATTALALMSTAALAVDVEMYGQVNKGVFAFDDGTSTDFAVSDNAKSSTRLGFKGAQGLDNGMTASFLFEGEMADNASDSFTQNTNFGTGGTPNTASFASRQARVGLTSNFGGLYVGKQSTAFDSVIAQDLVGAQDVMDIDTGDIGGGLQFRTAAGALTGPTVSSIAGLNSQNRANSVRYDSPIVAGFQGRASVEQGGDLEGSVFYTGEMAGFKAVAAGGVKAFNNQSTAGTNRNEMAYGASASLAHASGLAGTVGYTATTLERAGGAANVDEPSKWYVKAGYAWDAYEVAADYSTAEDYVTTTAANEELKSMGLAAQYNLGNGVSAGALYRNFEADVAGANYDDISLYGVNMRVKF
jgi:hypothetical protein